MEHMWKSTKTEKPRTDKKYHFKSYPACSKDVRIPNEDTAVCGYGYYNPKNDTFTNVSVDPKNKKTTSYPIFGYVRGFQYFMDIDEVYKIQPKETPQLLNLCDKFEVEEASAIWQCYAALLNLNGGVESKFDVDIEKYNSFIKKGLSVLNLKHSAKKEKRSVRFHNHNMEVEVMVLQLMY